MTFVPYEAAAAELERRRALALDQGGSARIARQHAKGRLTARERLQLFLGDGKFVEIGQLGTSDRPEVGEQAACDALIAGIAEINGRKVALIVGDATVLAGSTGRVGGRKQGIVVHLATKKGYPLVVLGDANGGRLPDFLGSIFAGIAGTYEGEELFGARHEKVRIPRVTAALGNTYGDPAIAAGMSDFVVMPENCTIALSGPELVMSALGEKTTHEEMGGPQISARQTGLVSKVVKTEVEAMEAIHSFLSYLPSNAKLAAPLAAARPPRTSPTLLSEIIPVEHNRGYDARRVLDAVVDEGSLFELNALFGRSLITALARIEGRSVGVVINQPMHGAGVLDAAALEKAEKLVDLCDDFGLPVVFLQDMPGVLIGSNAEKAGVTIRMAKFFKRVARARCPKVTIVLRKAYGAGWILLGGTPIGADYVCMWANAQLGFMASKNCVEILHRRRLNETRENEGPEAAEALALELEAEISRLDGPWTAASHAYIHDVIRPEDTRSAIIDGLFVACGYL